MNTPLYAFPKNFGPGEDPFVEFVQRANKEFPGFIERIIDGGAGTGCFTERVVDADPGCRVIDYEPLPENAKVLRSRFAGRDSVEIRQAALGDKSASVSFEVPERAGLSDHQYWVPGTSYGGFVSHPGIVPIIRSGFVPFAKHVAKKVLRRASSPKLETISVSMVRLDAELDAPPDVIKLDLQGGEPEALDGLGELLAHTKVVKIEVLLRGAMEGQGAARTRCARALHDAGFRFFVEDWQFHVPELTDALRRALVDNGAEIEREVRLHPSHPEVMVKGAWRSGQALPVQSHQVMGKLRAVELTRELSNALADAKASYFCVDLVALNGRFVQQWKSIIPPELLKKSGMQLDGQMVG